jgi:3-hydroxyisobutyrate dehydrogenase-like beta-hydroxyacid dehydrogenase
MTTALRVGIIGLGVMGIAYARNLLRAGFTVSGYDPAPAALEALAQSGGVAMADPQTVAAASDVILLVLPSVAALHASIAAMCPSLSADHVLAEMGTLPLEAKKAALDAVAATGAILLDCPVSGTGAQAAKGDLVVFASGEPAAIDRIGRR